MSKATFTEWVEHIDKIAERASLVEPGASYTRRFGRSYWFDNFYLAGLSPETAWEMHMEEEDE